MAVIFLNIFLTLSIFSISSFAQDVNQTDVLCGIPYPGTDKMISGVDITQLDLIPLDGSGIGGLRHPVIKVTCNNGKKKLQRSTGTVFAYPDQFARIMTVNSGSKSATVDVSRSYSEVKKKLAVSVGLSAKVWGVAFSASVSYKNTQNSMLKTNREVIDVTSKERSHKIDLQLPGAIENMLSPSFQKAINNLEGKTFRNDRESFEELISNFGTHYFKSGSFGGMIRKYIETSSSYSWTKTEQELAVQAKASYSNFIATVSASVGVEVGQSKVDSDFTKSTTEHVQYYGGEANLLDPNGLNHWQPTVDKDPILLSSKAEPLYKLVTNKSVQLEIEAAIDEYIMRNYLTEIQRKIHAAMRYNDPLIRQFTERLNMHKQSEFLDVDEVQALDEEIMYETEIPYWFSHTTELCMKYSPMHEGNIQCNGKRAKDTYFHCATPNHYTERYHDNTGSGYIQDYGFMGCYMYYGIKTINAPDWFDEKIRFCFDWKKYDTFWEAGMKKGGICAGPNTFTDYYYDFTAIENDNRGELKWKIIVDDEAPLWIRRTQLCFHWEPYHANDDGEQCGGGVARTLCARPNEWTATYTDKTTRVKDGGCYMQWSWRLVNY